ncbi:MULTISPECIES: ATP-dependent endonuclease [Paraburkholderia]|uniref:ATP-dependent nuclease n=1 Tax=Paraburkholderia TaxID=1822464 RepID=UPI00225173B8|nr:MULTISPECIES: AAA family ATPase [Paraburkholderia]MCX4161226.1 AAA family ATPase [Paraburkholderia megapolitana]MDN7156722.1 ATP-binding protein [Paraburkholderia sp. CHISQ3]MDQ6493767.1 ATP-binding protein [Paraburkholderia megapolitana]
MKITQFRIKNFRSIVDTNWCPFSRDGVTVFVGQNESGKTSVLDALGTTFSRENITSDDVRAGDPLPEISLRVVCTFAEIEPHLEGPSAPQLKTVHDFWEKTNGEVTVIFSWHNQRDTKKPFYCTMSLLNCEELEITLSELAPKTTITELPIVEPQLPPPASASELTPASAPQPLPSLEAQSNPIEPFSMESVCNAVYDAAPHFILFSEQSGILPNEIELDERHNPTGNGAGAAQNYLWAAGIDLPQMLASDRRSRESSMIRANARLTTAFNSFWSQTIGKATKLSLECEINFHENLPNESSVAGKPYLVFWISDGHTRLYPSQRSQGVRWFASFFLQLKAAKRLYDSAFFLLDEPGANLHSKAQADVLRLVNDLRHEIPIVYSTHSPHLIEYEHLHRILAVQRTGNEEDSPTTILDAHRLGAASTDTLSPILTAMGTDLASQQTIQRRHNVLLEEVSGYYYMRAFWRLTDQKQTAHFLASTGVNKLPALVNLFLGWGLEFITVVDDDNQGRGVFKGLLEDLYGGDQAAANKAVFKLKGFDGIEDVFSSNDFRRFVLGDETADISNKNTEYLKRAGRSKPIMALEFKLAVEKGQIQFSQLEESTQNAIKDVVNGVVSRLAEPIAKAAV